MFAVKSMPCSRPRHSERGHKPLTKRQEQLMFVCQLILGVTFKAVQLRYSLTKAQQPCRKPFSPIFNLIPCSELSFNRSVCGFFSFDGSFVVKLFTFTQSDFKLRSAVYNIQAERNN